MCFFSVSFLIRKRRSVDVVMETKGGKKKSNSSSSKSSKRQQYEAPLGYIIEDVRPHGGIEKFRSAAYSNCVRKPS
ncbi:S-adenosylmethionine decarboxylase proenzyme-like [Cucumis melo var. makuwa]|uniref:S-adenosylmethionine decarboxylase proenzyme-like n=1 Tax=Cucumis melo var. makuwa TaxID=1194695 RepID=A0A5D3BCP3_CUCMM|nr:S-adenosylmethionine decarboxylase proenzyme-like [Cucumis melo var. makuwa]